MAKHEEQSAGEQTQQNGWNLKELLERLDGDEGFLCELLVIFREDAQLNLERSRKAIAEHDLELLARAAHTLKGMLRNLSMGAAADTAAALETASRENRGSDARELLEKLEKELEGILPEVEAQLAGVRL